MPRRVLWTVLLASLAAAAALVACGNRADEAQSAENAPLLLGALEIPISRNHQGAQPSDAIRVEVSPAELRLDGTKVLDLERGRPAAAERSGHVLTKLRERIRSGPARARAILWISANAPYATLVEILRTLEETGVRETHYAVRTGTTGVATGFMKLARWRVAPEGSDPVRFEGAALPWSAFTELWGDVYASCREAGPERYIDCDGRPVDIAQGGELQVVLWTRGQGMKVTFMQVNAPDAGTPTVDRGPALIEGVRRITPTEEIIRAPPLTEGAYNFRIQEAVAEPSALSNTVRHVCAAQSCQVVVEADATTPCMRVLSLLGAAFPNGFVEPEIAFRTPRAQ